VAWLTATCSAFVASAIVPTSPPELVEHAGDVSAVRPWHPGPSNSLPGTGGLGRFIGARFEKVRRGRRSIGNSLAMLSNANQDDEIQELVERLRGKRLVGVRYWDTPGFGDADDDWCASGPHGVGHGVDLLVGTEIFGVTWSRDGLWVLPFSLVDFLLAGRFERVQEKDPWSSLVGRTVSGVRVHWLSQEWSDEPKRFPFALELRFPDGAFVVLAAASYIQPGEVAFPGGDDIVVAWQADHIRAVLPDLLDMQ
jgi:hypothetical protein